MKISEAIIHASTNDMHVEIEGVFQGLILDDDTGGGEIFVAKIDIEILGFDRPVCIEGMLDAGANCPAPIKIRIAGMAELKPSANRRASVTSIPIHVTLNLGVCVGAATGKIGQRLVEG